MRPPLATLSLLAATLLVGAAGCNPVYFRTPNLLHPGPAGPQRLDAIYHDPYPLDDVGPEVVGGRPRGYQRPVPETVRGRLTEPQSTQAVPAPLPMGSPLGSPMGQPAAVAPPAFTPATGF